MGNMSRSNEEEIYELLGQSPLTWLEQAEFLRMSATLILEKLREILPIPQVYPGIRAQKVAFIQSYLLLMGLSFENLIKGVHIAKIPNLSIENRMKKWKLYRKGHGISTLIKEIASVNSDEENLLKRLEEYAVWAGRYPIPMNTNQYLESIEPKNLRSFFTQDPALCDALFERLTSIIRNTTS
jgi:hypothetical protein